MIPKRYLTAYTALVVWNKARTAAFSTGPTNRPTSIKLNTQKDIQEMSIGGDFTRDKTIASLTRLLEKLEEDLKITRQLLEAIDDSGKANNQAESDMLHRSFVSGFDYGFVSRSEGMGYSEVSGDLPGYGPPKNVWSLGWDQFFRNLDAMKGEYNNEEEFDLSEEQRILRSKLDGLSLSNKAIWEREKKIPIVAPFVVKGPYLFLCFFLDIVFNGKYVFSRFFFLETVARMPYFSYISMIHLYETLGFWRRGSELKKIHHAEELNEFRHLLIQESLGGDQAWWVRLLAQHAAVAYYFFLCLLWLMSPSLSFFFSRCLETHAVHTYGQFLDENEEILKQLPPPLAAIEYYTFGSADPYYAEFQIAAVSKGVQIRRPGLTMTTLYDVFKAIQADEGDHVAVMEACLDPQVPIISPSIEIRFLTGAALAAAVTLVGASVGIPSGLEDLPGDDLVKSLIASGSAVTSSIFEVRASSETASGIEGAAEGAGLFAETSLIQKAVTGAVGGIIAGVVRLLNVRQSGDKIEKVAVTTDGLEDDVHIDAYRLEDDNVNEDGLEDDVNLNRDGIEDEVS